MILAIKQSGRQSSFAVNTKEQREFAAKLFDEIDTDKDKKLAANYFDSMGTNPKERKSEVKTWAKKEFEQYAGKEGLVHKPGQADTENGIRTPQFIQFLKDKKLDYLLPAFAYDIVAHSKQSKDFVNDVKKFNADPYFFDNIVTPREFENIFIAAHDLAYFDTEELDQMSNKEGLYFSGKAMKDYEKRQKPYEPKFRAEDLMFNKSVDISKEEVVATYGVCGGTTLFDTTTGTSELLAARLCLVGHQKRLALGFPTYYGKDLKQIVSAYQNYVDVLEQALSKNLGATYEELGKQSSVGAARDEAASALPISQINFATSKETFDVYRKLFDIKEEDAATDNSVEKS